MLLYVTDVAVYSAVEFDLFALFNSSLRVIKPPFFSSASIESQENRSNLFKN